MKQSGTQNIPVHRKRMYAAIVFLVPVLAIILTEILLRLVGYGSDPVFFLRQTISGREYVRLNEGIAKRYFPNLDAAPAASSDLFPVEKPPGSKRVFFIGASSMLGYPYMFNASMSAIIRDAFRNDDPDVNVEVVNLSMTAVTSHFVLDVGIASLEYRPDLIVLYTGHNEYYGGLGVASTESVGPPWLTRLYLRLQELRLVQGLGDLVRYVFAVIPDDQEASGTLMEALAREKEISYDSGLFHAGVQTFRRNITDLANVANQAGVRVLLSTVVSNLRDRKPFRSIHRATVSQFDRTRMDSLLTVFDALPPQNALLGSDLLQEALNIDSGYARATFALASVKEREGEYNEAYILYSRARDQDGLRFRAPASLNRTIMDMEALAGVSVIDIDSLIREFAINGIPGDDLLHEHVHPTVAGYETIATIMYPRIRELLELQTLSSNPGKRLKANVTGIDTIAATMRLDILLNSWPFTDSRRSLSDIDPSGWEEEIAHAYLEGTYTWEQMHVLCAERYVSDRQFHRAAREYEALLAATPYNISPYLRLGSVYLSMGERQRARGILEASLSVERTSRAFLLLGQMAYEEGRYGDAIDALRQALSVGQIDAQQSKDVRLSLAVALQKDGRKQEALDEVRRLRALSPDFTPAAELEAYLTK